MATSAVGTQNSWQGTGNTANAAGDVTKGARAAGFFDSVVAKTNELESDSADGIEDRFLKLLVAQMRNQDPMDPLDNAQFTSQLAQISTVRGIESLNQSMKAVSSSNAQSSTLASLSLLGKQVLVPGDKFNHQPVEGQATRVGFELTEAATAARVEILDANGTRLYAETLNNIEPGMHTFDWNGRDGSNRAVPAGLLQVQVIAVDGTTAVDATTLVPARVMGVTQDKTSGPQLDLDTTKPVAPSDVRVFL